MPRMVSPLLVNRSPLRCTLMPCAGVTVSMWQAKKMAGLGSVPLKRTSRLPQSAPVSLADLIDAHADINTEKTSPSANAHGMPLAAAIGLGAKELTDINKNKLNPENVYIIGARDLDPGEVEICRDKKVNLYEMGKCRTEGISKILDEALEKVEKDKIDTIHLSFDIDALDRLLVPGTGTPVSNGFALEEGIEVIRRIMGTKKVRTIDLVEFNPRIDKDDLALKSTLSLLEAMFKYM